METVIDVYADPLDPRGWGSEPAVRRLRLALPDADWRLRPVVMVPDWDRYDGPELAGRAAAPSTSLRVSEESGMPIDEFLWFEDAPTSSAPAARGVAAALEQGEVAGWRLLRALREATFLRRTNLDTEAAVVSVARSTPGVGAEELAAALDAGVELPDVRDATTVSGVEAAGDRPSLPTVVVRGAAGERGISGFVDAASLDRVAEAATGAMPTPASPKVPAAIERFSPEGWLAPVELSALSGVGYDDATAAARGAEGIAERGFASEPFFRDTEYVDGGGEEASEQPAGNAHGVEE